MSETTAYYQPRTYITMNTTTLHRVAIGSIAVFVSAFASVTFVLFTPERTHAASFTPLSNQLAVGMSGQNVTTLQTLLATDPNVYPQALVTGYYGQLTANAVSQFQIGYGLPPVGRVGPQTLALINQLIANGNTTVDVSAPSVSNLRTITTQTSATITWSTNEQAFGSVHYDSVPISTMETSSVHQEPQTSGTLTAEILPGVSHNITIMGLVPGQTYYFSTESRDLTGNVTLTLSQPFVTIL